MSSLNDVTLIGNLGSDPEMKYIPNGKAVCEFPLATSRQWKNKDGSKGEDTQWHRCVVWEARAETCAKYLKKGSKICVKGEIRYDKWEKDGVKMTSAKIHVSNFVFLDKKGDTQAATSNQPADDSDIPF